MRYKLVTFDFTGTLVGMKSSVGRIYADVANRYYLAGIGKNFKEDIVERNFIRSYRYFCKKFPCFGHNTEFCSENWWFLVVNQTMRLSGLADRRFIRSISNQLYSDFSTTKHWTLYPDVKKILYKLRKKDVKLGIVSNFDDRLPLIMKCLQIDNCFDLVLCSGIVGVEKPDSKIYTLALNLAEVDAEEALHVGNDIKLDYRAAKAVGLESLLIDRRSKESPKVGVSTITSISELDLLLD